MADKKDGLLETIKTIFWALLIAGVFRTVFFQPFFIPTGSMKDTLLIGDFVFVNKMAYGYSKYSCPLAMCPIPGRILGSEPERGDIIVFRHPALKTDYVKRLIGLPGDRIQVQRWHALHQRRGRAAGARRACSKRSSNPRAASARCRNAPTARSARAGSA